MLVGRFRPLPAPPACFQVTCTCTCVISIFMGGELTPHLLKKLTHLLQLLVFPFPGRDKFFPSTQTHTSTPSCTYRCWSSGLYDAHKLGQQGSTLGIVRLHLSLREDGSWRKSLWDWRLRSCWCVCGGALIPNIWKKQCLYWEWTWLSQKSRNESVKEWVGKVRESSKVVFEPQV